MKIVRFLAKLLPIALITGIGFLGSNFGKKLDKNIYNQTVQEKFFNSSSPVSTKHTKLIANYSKDNPYNLQNNEFLLCSQDKQYISKIKVEIVASKCQEGCNLLNEYFKNQKEFSSLNFNEIKISEGINTNSYLMNFRNTEDFPEKNFSVTITKDDKENLIIKGNKISGDVYEKLDKGIFIKVTQEFNNSSVETYLVDKDNKMSIKKDTMNIIKSDATINDKIFFDNFFEEDNKKTMTTFDYKSGFFSTIKPLNQSRILSCYTEPKKATYLFNDSISLENLPLNEEVVGKTITIQKDDKEVEQDIYPAPKKIFNNMLKFPQTFNRFFLNLMNKIINKTNSGILGMISILFIFTIINLYFIFIGVKQSESEEEIRKAQEVAKIKYSNDPVRLEEEINRLNMSNSRGFFSNIITTIPQLILFLVMFTSICDLSMPLRSCSFLWLDNLFYQEPFSIFNLYGLLPFTPFSILQKVGGFVLLASMFSLEDYWKNKDNIKESLWKNIIPFLLFMVLFTWIFNKPVRLIGMAITSIFKQISVAIIKFFRRKDK